MCGKCFLLPEKKEKLEEKKQGSELSPHSWAMYLFVAGQDQTAAINQTAGRFLSKQPL